MNACLVCLAAVFAAAPTENDESSVYTATPHFAASIRGQTPPYEEPTVPEPAADASPSVELQPPVMSDLQFQTVVPPYGPTYAAPGGACCGDPTGPVCGDPCQTGWVHRIEMGILPKAPTNVRGLGNFGVFELDVDLEYNTPVPSGRIFTFTQQFNLRGWDGPKSSPFFPGVGLPGNVYRFGWDMAFFKPEQAGWSYEFGFTPSMNSDFNDGMTSNAWNFDGRWVFYYKSSDTIKYALGAGYWDRVNDRVIPYAGVIWTPSNRWDLRFLFPESRISLRLRDRGRFAESLYARGEFHAEAYEVDLEVAGGRDKIELTDWRILIGLQFDDIVGSPIAAFVEAGWVFDRQIQFLSERPDFNVSTGFIARAGVQY